jgi:3-methyladenine DNA glycosylase/8-oxoguanine DNA glycosylase
VISPPYDLHLTARLMARYHGVLETHRADGYYRAVAPAGDASLFRATQDRPDAPVIVEIIAGPDTPAVHARAAHVLGVSDDFSGFYAMAEGDERLWPVVESLYGLHHFASETVFEALAQVLIEQQISLSAALKAQRTLAEWGGRFIDHEGERYYRFPHVQQIAEANAETLFSLLKITRRRVAYLQAIARDIAAGRLDLEALRGVPAEEAYASLTALKGIGHWTAAWTLIRGLGVYAYAGHNDVALRDAVAHYFFDSDERVSAATVDAVFAEYAPYSGLAAFYTLMAWAVAHY